MLPTKLSASDPEDLRRRYAIVTLNTMATLCPGSLILAASVDTGLVLLRHPDNASQEYNFPPNSIRIVVAK